MNKKTYIILGVVVLVIIIIFGVIVWNHKTAQAPVVSNNLTSTTSTVAQISSSTSSSTATSSVKVTIQGDYKGSSFSLSYPIPSWSIVSLTPFSLDTFGGKFGANGVIPNGGALINIATTTAYGSVQDIINTELMNATDVITGTQTVDGISCEKETYQANYAPGYSSENITLYCSRGTELWKIYLSYGANDPAASTHISDFDAILASMKFLP